jgi:SOS-response transcriptional repressor LexA
MNETRPSKKQRELLTFIEQFITEHGYGPSYREIMRGIGYKSVSTVAIHVNNLITKGHLRKRTRSARSLEVTNPTGGAFKASPVGAAQEKWLVDLINQKFHSAEMKAEKVEEKVIDELYVLVGALHVLGLGDAARAAKSRLLALEKTPTEG